MAFSLFLAMLIALLPVSTASGQERGIGATLVVSGQSTRVGLINIVDPQNCRVPDDLVGTVSRGPGNGEVELRREDVVLTTDRCTRVQVSSYAIYYRSRPGFVGRDRLVVTFRSEVRNTTDVYMFAVDVR